jgi:hypothetical protein
MLERGIAEYTFLPEHEGGVLGKGKFSTVYKVKGRDGAHVSLAAPGKRGRHAASGAVWHPELTASVRPQAYRAAPASSAYRGPTAP